MAHVIRRLSLLLALLLALAACAGDERSTVGLGDESMSRTELTDLVISVSGGIPEGAEDPTSLDAERMRQVASVYVRDLALTEYFEANGFAPDAAVIDAAEAAAAQRFENQEFGFLAFDSAGYRAIVNAELRARQPSEAFYDSPEEVPGIFATPPVVDDVSFLQIPAVLQNPQVAAQPELLSDPAFAASLLEDPQILDAVVGTARFNRQTEIVKAFSDDIIVESRLGEWDSETARFVAGD